jgi:Sulfotransferase domain
MKQTPNLPNFIIIGAQKGGTTSLYVYLTQHPQIAPATQKEIHYFDLQFDKGAEWYYAQFPTLEERGSKLTGESSPYYIFCPHVPQRIYDLCPDVKLIVLLRNPVDRAISHYYHYKLRIDHESLSFEEAIAREPERLKGELEKLLADPSYYSFEYQHHSYLARGIYADQLPAWFKLFPKSQILILKSEDLYANPCETYNTVLEFLNLPPHQLGAYEKYNATEYPRISETVYQQLKAYFKPHNQRLAEMLDRDFGWD